MSANVQVPSVASPDGADACPAGEPEPPIGLDLDIVHDGGDWGAPAPLGASARDAAAAVAAELGVGRLQACLALSDDAQVARLNAAYRGKSGPTNVLSFPAGRTAAADAAGARVIGDVVLAAGTVRREAAELELPLQHHLQHLVVHGLLHLLGYDHLTDQEAQAMEGLEARILSRLGVADPYAAAGAPAKSRQHCADPQHCTDSMEDPTS